MELEWKSLDAEGKRRYTESELRRARHELRKHVRALVRIAQDSSRITPDDFDLVRKACGYALSHLFHTAADDTRARGKGK